MRRLRSVLVTAIVFGTLVAWVGAPRAFADSVWFQSVARASASAPCPDPSFGTPWEEHWNPAEQPWRPSWAWWPNGGKGGFTCDRAITWAKSSPQYPSAGCLRLYDGSGETYYVDFRGGWALGSDVRYNEAACSTLYVWGGGSTGPIDLDIVYAPPGTDPTALCLEAFGFADRVTRSAPGDIWFCRSTTG